MDDLPLPDPVFDALRMARPATPTELTDPAAPAATALLEQIVSVGDESITEPRPLEPVRSRRLGRLALAGVAVASVAAAVAVLLSPSVDVRHGRVTVSQQPDRAAAAVDIPAIARATRAAVSSTGRATLTFEQSTEPGTTLMGTSKVTFAGSDLDIALHFDGDGRTPAFDAHNRTVDGELYLLDGPPGQLRWYHDINASPKDAGDVVHLDPRTLLRSLSPKAGFVLVADPDARALGLRHLRAAHPDQVPALDLTLGPLDSGDLTGLDLWVDEGQAVRRLDLTTSHTQADEPACFEQDGVKQCAQPGDSLRKGPDGTLTVIHDGKGPATPTVRTTTSRYSVRFTDLGTPLTVRAPNDPIVVRGQG